MFTIDYSFYTNVYGGSLIKEADFTRLSDRAIGTTNSYVLIDLYSDYDISTELDLVLHKAVCAVAEVISSALASGGSSVKPVLQSESVAGTWSKTYSTGDNQNAYANMEFAVIATLTDYLGGTDLLFKGGFICG
jgi:hypothetical protein